MLSETSIVCPSTPCLPVSWIRNLLLLLSLFMIIGAIGIQWIKQVLGIGYSGWFDVPLALFHSFVSLAVLASEWRCRRTVHFAMFRNDGLLESAVFNFYRIRNTLLGIVSRHILRTVHTATLYVTITTATLLAVSSFLTLFFDQSADPSMTAEFAFVTGALFVELTALIITYVLIDELLCGSRFK